MTGEQNTVEPNSELPPFDESKLSEEDKDIHLFQWLSSTRRTLEDASLAVIKVSQSHLEETMLKAIEGADSYPVPGHSLRKLVSRCLVLIYTRGDTRTLFDILQRLLKLVVDSKPTSSQDISKTAVLFCIGELMLSFGSQVMSLMNDVAAASLKICKSSSSVTLLRYHAFKALGKSLRAARRALTDVMTRDIVKQMKSGLVDKSLPIQRAACEVVVTMYPSGAGLKTVAEVETFVNLCTRSLEGADQLTRRSLASVVGHILASTQTEIAQPEPDVSKRGRLPGDDDNEPISLGNAGSEERRSILNPTEMLIELSSQFNKPSASRRLRVGIFDFYAALLTTLGPTYVEKHYPAIVSHFMTDIISNPRNSTTRYDVLLVRALVCILLRDLIGVRLLSEQGQISAIQELASSYLKRWPALMPGQVEPSHLVISVVLREVAGLLQQLGNTPPPVQDALTDPLATLLSHPNHTTRISAAWALQCFCYCTPLRLPKIILIVMEKLQRDINSIASPATPSDVHCRALGHAYGLGALLSVVPDRPLYVSYDISAKVLDMAIQLLKRAGEHDVQVAAVEVEVAWTSIASLMTLGPNFVRTYLPQLLVLWRNALPKPTSKDTTNGSARGVTEWYFLLHVRESALGAVLCFLRHNNQVLVTLDVSRRLSSLLSNALQFSNAFLSQSGEEVLDQQISVGGIQGLTLRTREALLRRRIYQCFTLVGFSGITESTQSSLLQITTSLFASADGYAGSSLQAAIASSSGTFTSVWHSGDGYAYGLTHTDITDDASDSTTNAIQSEKNRDTIEISIDNLLCKPILGSCEHDPLALWETRTSSDRKSWPEPPPPTTSVVDAALGLFAQLLPIQDASSAAKAVSHLVESTKAVKPDRNAGRRAAVIINANIALCLAMRHATSNSRHARDALGHPKVTSILSAFLKESLVDGDPLLRNASSEAIGRLSSLAGTNFMTGQIKMLVDEIVGNRDPNSRAGCALAFGAIYGYVGGLAAGPLLKTAVNMLMSLSNDPHPLVHFWALRSLARVIEAASLAYAPFVSSTLGMLFKVYTLDSHEAEGGTIAYANMSGDLPTYQAVCQVIDGVITVLGPDIQESHRTRTLILDLVHEFFTEDDEGICVEAIKCIQHFLMFAADHARVPALVAQFRVHMSSSRRPLKVASINALYQLVQKDAISMSKLGGDRLVEELFGMLDDDSSIDGVRNVISSWLQQTVIHNPSAWIDLCQRIMSRTTATQQVADAAAAKPAASQDDEGESLSIGMNQDSNTSHRMHLTSRWRTQLFALRCLHSICVIVGQSGRQEHISIPFAKSQGLPTTGLLVTRVPDLIKMAFTASAAYVTEIRLEGLTVLRDVIEIFAPSPDPLYDDALLLEQHQAPITAALTPAFSSDTTPEILALAIEACAVFVGCGVVKDVNRMGRILKHLTSALEQSKDTGMLSLGDAGELSPNASVMLRIATLSAWAELAIASSQQTYLKNVIKPFRSILASLWVSSLRDYASIRADSEVLQDNSSAALDTSYSSLGKEVLLPYYHSSWPIILEAVAVAMQDKDPHVLAAMDGHEGIANGTTSRTEPTALFFVIFGLVYEALATASPDSDNPVLGRKLPVIALKSLKSLVGPDYSGYALLEPATFDELISLFYRMAITESALVRVHLVETISALVVSQNKKLAELDAAATAAFSVNSFPSTAPRVQCLRICAYVLRHAIATNVDAAADRVNLINAAFNAYQTVSKTFGDPMQEELCAVGISLYGELLKSEKSEVDFTGPTLPSLKMLLERPVGYKDPANKYAKLVHGIISACLLNIDEMRGRQGSISTRKVQSNLLAAVLILTVIPTTVRVSQVVVEHCCALICQKLLELEVSLTAAHCAKTLMMAATSGNRILRQCPKLLIPGMIEFIAKSASVEEDSSMEDQRAALGEVWKATSTLFSSTPEEARARLLGVLLPTVNLVLDPSTSPPSALHTQGVTQLLLYATSSPAVFKETTSTLTPAMRENLEISIRQAVANRGSAQGQQAAKPQISLRSF